MKEKQNNTTGLSSMLAHVRSRLETTYIYTQNVVAELTVRVCTAFTEFLCFNQIPCLTPATITYEYSSIYLLKRS
jgi:hypothetical protein